MGMMVNLNLSMCTVPEAMDDAQRLLKTMLGLSTAWLAPENHVDFCSFSLYIYNLICLCIIYNYIITHIYM